MRRIKRSLALISGVLMLGLVAEAGAEVAADFSPTIEFSLDDAKSLGNPSVRVVVKQETGEEELASVELKVPAGFTLAGDAQLQDAEKLGDGMITIDAGPRCRGAPAGSVPAQAPVEIIERNRRSSEIADGVVAIYVVDIKGVVTIPLSVKGNPDKGYTLFGPINPNADTCPPFTFNARFFKKAERSGTAIFTNPQFGGDYTFGATFKGLQGGTSQSEQIVKIEGPAGGGGGGTTISDAEKRKKCKRIKNKQRRRKCLQKLKG